MSSEWMNNAVIAYQLTIEIQEESTHDNLMYMHDGQAFRLANIR
jgi:hypothetical protein